MDNGFIMILIFFGGLSFLVSMVLKRKFAKYSKVPTSSGLSGAEIGLRMLGHYGINDVKIVEGKGFLTDHYNPKTKVISLSPPVFRGRNVSAAAVAAHECGHAVQHAREYGPLRLRSSLVPVVQLSSRMWIWLIMGAFFMGGVGSAIGGSLFIIGIAMLGMATLFSLITLPVEFDASNRALAWLDNTGITQGREYDGAKDALKWAARTYVVAAIGSVVQLLYFIGLARD